MSLRRSLERSLDDSYEMDSTQSLRSLRSAASLRNARRHKASKSAHKNDADEATATLLQNGSVDDLRHSLPLPLEPPAIVAQNDKIPWYRFGARQPSSSKSRIIPFRPSASLQNKYPVNIVQNQKYNIISFVPIVLYEQFKFFFNAYFLLVALSQIIPALRIGYLATYIVPLAAVLLVTMGKEAYDDWQRYLRDAAANSTRYQILEPATGAKGSGVSVSHHTNSMDTALDPEALSPAGTFRSVPSSRLRVGDLVMIEKNQRVPADLILLRTSDSSGTCFIRTDQLDGETDWKLKVALDLTQRLPSDDALMTCSANIYADPPSKDIHSFFGTLTKTDDADKSPLEDSVGGRGQTRPAVPISAENLLWANTVLAAGSAIGFVVYTGSETRAVMNTSHPQTKVGLLDLEVNKIAKILCSVTFALSVVMVAFNGFRGPWYIYVFRFLILFSTIIPISLRVNLDMGKTVYAHQIQHDPEIKGTVVRTSTLPEELGRIEYLLSDKTGTLTRNEMEMKKLHMGTISYGHDAMDEVAAHVSSAFAAGSPSATQPLAPSHRGRRDLSVRVREAVFALALCHNVTPVHEEDHSVTYQASSPDEVAIVKWTESVGLTLHDRDRSSIRLRSQSGIDVSFDILEIFPFTSETKRMGIVIRDKASEEITFYEKGADVVMAPLVQTNDWLEEECGNMAREGLRTLVIGRKRLTEETWQAFDTQYRRAKISMDDRNSAMQKVVGSFLERELELLAITGVEDKLQDDVKPTLELLRNAGIRIWMLTGDKIETATCIAISSKLVSRGQYIHKVAQVRSAAQIRDELELLQTRLDCCLVIDGESLSTAMTSEQDSFIRVATQLPCVVACRCSPTQKADIAKLIRKYTKKRVCCIGDGGNDVSMIQAADVGIGIVGKEGKQASLAADFSILQFSYLSKLLCWHGRNSYKRSAKLAQFVVHRGLLVAVIQAVFSAIVFFSPVAIFQDWLSVGYATIYTMGPVFSLVLDTDINESLALVYPELYAELTKGRSLSYKTFFIWVLISVYQGGAIMVASMLLFESQFLNIVSIAFTATILNELVMVAVEITTWHFAMISAEVGSLVLYAASMAFLPRYFDLGFVLSAKFIGKVGIIVAVSAFPLVVIKYIKQKLAPSSYAKVLAF